MSPTGPLDFLHLRGHCVGMEAVPARSTLAHDTVRLEQLVVAPRSAVWQAYADTGVRSQWSVPAGQTMVFDADDFQTGGRARYRCGTPDSMEFHGTMEYHFIESEQTIVYTETVRIGEQLLATSLISWEFVQEVEGVCVVVTDHITSYVGQEMIDDSRQGHSIALEQLVELLE